jgi:hypothetical protein
MLSGLDEFMLRLGHLKMLCRVASEFGGSLSRVEKETAAALTRLTPVPTDLTGAVTDYLLRKRLCPVLETGGLTDASKPSDYRYSDLIITKAEGQPLQLRDIEGSSGGPQIWWQDLCLAAPGIRSRVGAVTTSGKSGSKTGLSHISDWAEGLDLIDRSGSLSPEGRLLTRGGKVDPPSARDNPYFLGNERILLAYLQIGADIDVFSRLAGRLLTAAIPIRKSDGARLFGETMEGIAVEADNSRHLSASQQYRIAHNLRDLESAVRRGGVITGPIGGSSTAWHRTASRLETYVDLGLLEKGRGGEEELYEYTYYPTEALERAVASLDEATLAETWIEEHLVAALFGGRSVVDSIAAEEAVELLRPIAACLERPTAPLPITTLALGLVLAKLDSGEPISIGAARRGIEELARARPDVGRLSRGRSGDRAEFVSLKLGGH